jgi:hypothetical protein
MIGLSGHFVSRVNSTALIESGGLIIAAILLVLFLTGALSFWLLKKKKSSPKSLPARKRSNNTVYDAFEQLNGSSRSVLLAATRINDLPVTVPINLAIQLAQKGKCLLIDFDSKRDAMAQAFEIDSSKINTDLIIRPVSTLIDNLDIWPAGFFNCYRQMNLRMLIEAANKKYDHILLYAPYLPALPDRNQIAYCAKRAVIFSMSDNRDSPLYHLLESQNCRILSRQQADKGL